MTTYDSLTQKQKDNIQLVDTQYRSLLRYLSKISKATGIDLDTLNDFTIANVDGIIASLDAGEIIPDSTNLAGSSSLTKTEWLTMQGILRTLKTTKSDNQPLLTKVVGIDAS